MSNVLPPPAQPQRKALEGVQPARAARDAADESAHKSPQLRIDEARQMRLAAHLEARATPSETHSTRVNRALMSYAVVAADNERGALSDMLGVDEFA